MSDDLDTEWAEIAEHPSLCDMADMLEFRLDELEREMRRRYGDGGGSVTT